MSLDLFELGDRVEYPIPGLLPLGGGEPEPAKGTVIDVVRGEAGELQIVASRPDAALQGQFRIDYHFAADPNPTVRLVR